VYGNVSEQGAAASWLPFDADSGSSLFSNMYLVLAVLHVAMLLFYRLQFRAPKTNVAVER
jgi:DHA2 family metal-tetracycline-proton antiporter-like MFS transporter